MSSIPQRLYNEVMMADDFTCVYCGVRSADVVIDHVIPQSVGGPDVFHNLVTACAPCNGRKSDAPLHLAGMALQYGRFSGTPSPLPRIHMTLTKRRRPADRPSMDRLDDLALIRDADGNFLYSANELVRMIRGYRNEILRRVRAIRAT